MSRGDSAWRESIVYGVLGQGDTGMNRMMRIVALGVVLAAALGSSQARGERTFLRTQGQDMVDESGGKVLLQGVGLGNWMLPEGYMWRFGDQGDRPRKIEKIVADLIGPENGSPLLVGVPQELHHRGRHRSDRGVRLQFRAAGSERPPVPDRRRRRRYRRRGVSVARRSRGMVPQAQPVRDHRHARRRAGRPERTSTTARPMSRGCSWTRETRIGSSICG